MWLSWLISDILPGASGGGTGPEGPPGKEGKEGPRGPEGPEGKVPEIVWKAIEGVNANLVNTSVRVGVSGGVIYLTGMMTVSAEILAAGVLFTLPVGARPEKEMFIPTGYSGATVYGGVLVKPSGEVVTKGALKTGMSPFGFGAVIPLK